MRDEPEQNLEPNDEPTEAETEAELDSLADKADEDREAQLDDEYERKRFRIKLDGAAAHKAVDRILDDILALDIEAGEKAAVLSQPDRFDPD